jgi:hypothetical protein
MRIGDSSSSMNVGKKNDHRPLVSAYREMFSYWVLAVTLAHAR